MRMSEENQVVWIIAINYPPAFNWTSALEIMIRREELVACDKRKYSLPGKEHC